MRTPGVVWVALVLLLIPVVQQFAAQQWPEQSYPMTALIVGVLGALAKWLELYWSDGAQTPPGAPADIPPAHSERSGRLRRFLLG